MKTCLNKIHLFFSPLVLLILIVLLALFFRLYGLDWDQGQHLHPDERFLAMVITALKIPKTFLDYLNPQISTMNPYNVGYNFFVYGTFPINLAKIAGLLTNNNDYWNIHLAGRVLSALFDVGVVFLLYKIGKKIFNEKVGLLSAFLYTIMVLPIQLSHFFAVDTFLNFFIVLSFYLLIILIQRALITNYLLLITSAALGGSFGLALACKISALYFLPIIGLGFFYLFILSLKSPKTLKPLIVVTLGIIFTIITYLVFRIAQPSFFSSGNFLNLKPNLQFIKNINELKSYDNPDSWFPPAVQWHDVIPIISPLKNMVLWGTGLPLGIISILAVIYTLITLISPKPPKNLIISLVVIWLLGLFIYQGIQFCTTMRYFLPVYPFLAILSANFLIKTGEYLFMKISRPLFLTTNCLLLITLLIYPVSFLSIYSRPVTRVTASEWIYKNIPAGSIVINEEWDDGLPLGLPNYNNNDYKWEQVMMYDFDTPEKWQRINKSLDKAGYIFLTSNRAYGSTMKVPEKYPQTIKYYQSLFSGTGEFKKIAEFTSYPCFPPIGKSWFCFNDDSAEEAFTVYDHPKAMIFEKK